MSQHRKSSMYVSLTCSCEAHLEIDVVPGDEAPAWVLMHRFANAHSTCGYVTEMKSVGIEG